MLETAIALYTAHLIADFILQPGWMVAQKKRPAIMALHIIIVIATTIIVAGTIAWLPLLIIGAVHLIIDVWKQIFGGQKLAGFIIDQCAHLLSVVIVAMVFPGIFTDGLWENVSMQIEGFDGMLAQYPTILAIFSGLIVTLRMGGFAIGLFIDRFNYQPDEDDAGLENGGLYIGLLERAMIFLLVMVDQVAGIGFLVAAKSILRFGASQDRKTGEYVIVGTLASFIWALTAAFATRAVISLI